MKTTTVNLAAVVDALEMASDELRAYLDRETGEILQFGMEELGMAEEEEEEDLSECPEWQLAIIEAARRVFSDTSGRYVELPDQFEVNEYRALERFSWSQTDPAVADELSRAISGSGAFRRFKDAVHRLGLTEAWYTYLNAYHRDIARRWCEGHDIPYRESP